MSRPACYIKKIGTLSLWVQTKAPPSDEEWDKALREVDAWSRSLVFTDGGAPSSAQRKKLAQLVGGRSDNISAILSYAIIPRFVNASVALVMKSLRSYNPEEFPLAIEYLKITNEEKPMILSECLEAQKYLGLENTITVTRALKAAKWV